MDSSLSAGLGPLVVFLLLATCAGLWYAARALRQTRGAPKWAGALDRYRGLALMLLGLAVLSLVGFGISAIVAILSEGL